MASAELRRAFQAARTEFKELSIQELKDYEQLFVKYDTGGVSTIFFHFYTVSLIVYLILGW